MAVVKTKSWFRLRPNAACHSNLESLPTWLTVSSMPRIIKPHEERHTSIVEFEPSVQEAFYAKGDIPTDPASILADARDEAERKVQEAYAEGMRRGLESGEAKFHESVGEAAQALQAAAEAMTEKRVEFLDSLSPQVVQLAEAIAARILTREIREDSEAVLGIARGALEKILDEEEVRLRVNPGDVETLRSHRVTLLEEFDALKVIEVVADEGVTSGGCIAESERLHIDAQLESQLAEILGKILD